MRELYMEQIDKLNEKLRDMSHLVEMAIDAAVSELDHPEKSSADDVAEIEALIDRMEKEIEAFCMRLILEQAPVATDFRIISSALKMITDMERIGDQADDITELLVQIQNFAFMDKLPHIREMADTTKLMVNDAISAYVSQNTELAVNVIDRDDKVDQLFVEVKNEVIRAVKENEDAEAATDFLMIAKYLERIGDHATNVAEWAIYSVTGIRKKA